MRRRMEVCGDDDERATGDGLDETSWVMMRLYACMRRMCKRSWDGAGEIDGGRVPLRLRRQIRRL